MGARWVQDNLTQLSGNQYWVQEVQDSGTFCRSICCICVKSGGNHISSFYKRVCERENCRMVQKVAEQANIYEVFFIFARKIKT